MLVRHKQFSYNFETYSAKDIVEFLCENGFGVLFQKRRFIVERIPLLSIRLPFIDMLLETDFTPALRLTGDVLWENKSDYYYTRDNTLRHPDEFRSHERLFNQLKRKFAMKLNEYPHAIKDLAWIRGIEKKKEVHFPACKRT